MLSLEIMAEACSGSHWRQRRGRALLFSLCRNGRLGTVFELIEIGQAKNAGDAKEGAPITKQEWSAMRTVMRETMGFIKMNASLKPAPIWGQSVPTGRSTAWASGEKYRH